MRTYFPAVHPVCTLIRLSIIAILLSGLTLCADAQSYSFKDLLDFNGSNGNDPLGGVTLDASGNLYSTAASGGAKGFGDVFKISSGGVFTDLLDFNVTNGANPFVGVILDASGNLYGTASGGGANLNGVLYKLSSNGTYTDLVDFGSSPFGGDSHEGVIPGGIALDAAGNVYGRTYTNSGGLGGGVIYKYSTDGKYTVLHTFNDTDTNAIPVPGLKFDASGNMYGTTYSGGAAQANGQIFKITPDGTYTDLFDFNGTNGAHPLADVVFDAAGNLYGTTSAGGANGDGDIFKLAPDGTFTDLFDFNGANGSDPISTLVFDSTGNLYGTTYKGGANGDGEVFKLAPDGTFTDLLDFNGANGANPSAGVVLDSSGNLYGTTTVGGANGDGLVYELPIQMTPEPGAWTMALAPVSA